jgi:hypothetical protein
VRRSPQTSVLYDKIEFTVYTPVGQEGQQRKCEEVTTDLCMIK